MKIYTRTGDDGRTGLLGGIRLPKSALRIDCYGEVDELNAAVGAARTHVKSAGSSDLLSEIQRDLFAVGALLADPKGASRSEKTRLDPGTVTRLEAHIDRLQSDLPELKQFILPGGSPGGALLHVARSICRRAERATVRLSETEAVPDTVIPYLNRLSDLLFILARFENHDQDVPEEAW